MTGFLGRIHGRGIVSVAAHLVLMNALWWPLMMLSPTLAMGEEGSAPKSIRKTCGSCPDGYAMTGTMAAPEICKDGDPTLVQCIPLGANMLPICGSCPEGYVEIGRSSVPARCGNKDGGLLSQCQLQKLESTLPDPTQGFKSCPPDCGTPAVPGQGNMPKVPQSRPAPEEKKSQ